MSSAPNQGGMHEYHIQMVNHFINKEFWLLNKYPEFQHLLLCLCGTGRKQFHKWIPANNKKNIKWLELFKDGNKDISDLEMKILKSINTEKDIHDLAMNLGNTENEAEAYVQDFKQSNI